MKIKRFIGGSLESNGYILYENKGEDCYVIDPGYNPKVFIDFIKENQLHPKGIILTHLHHDHVGAAEAIKDVFQCPEMMHEKDAFAYKKDIDIHLTDGDEFHLGNELLKIINTPGHTKGSICIMCPRSKVCFTGDTIFDTDLGRSDLSGGSEEDMRNTIINIVNKWDNETYIYPGHDNGCNMKFVRKNNKEFLALRDGNDR